MLRILHYNFKPPELSTENDKALIYKLFTAERAVLDPQLKTPISTGVFIELPNSIALITLCEEVRRNHILSLDFPNIIYHNKTLDFMVINHAPSDFYANISNQLFGPKNRVVLERGTYIADLVILK